MKGSKPQNHKANCNCFRCSKVSFNKGKKGLNRGHKPYVIINGENNPNWKGGISPLNRRLRNSSMWRIWRELVFQRDNFTCQNPRCEFCHNLQGVYLHPHHIKPFADYPELRFKVSNGITYCKGFHINSKSLHKEIMKGGSIQKDTN